MHWYEQEMSFCWVIGHSIRTNLSLDVLALKAINSRAESIRIEWFKWAWISGIKGDIKKVEMWYQSSDGSVSRVRWSRLGIKKMEGKLVKSSQVRSSRGLQTGDSLPFHGERMLGDCWFRVCEPEQLFLTMLPDDKSVFPHNWCLLWSH